jgi:hypothetical protein
VQTLWRIWKLRRSPVWKSAKKAVKKVASSRVIQEAAGKERTISFCPRCGQSPDGDRRMEEAREMVVKELGYVPRRSDLDFALSWLYWRSK